MKIEDLKRVMFINYNTISYFFINKIYLNHLEMIHKTVCLFKQFSDNTLLCMFILGEK